MKMKGIILTLSIARKGSMTVLIPMKSSSSYVPKNSRIPYYALLRQRNPFHVDKTGADGGGVPIGFSDRRHKMALARKRVTDEEFMFAVKQRRKEKRKEIKRRRKYLLKLNAQNKRRWVVNKESKKYNADKVGSVGQRIALKFIY